MKNMKKLVGLVLAMVMVVAMAAVALADDTKYEISVKDGDTHEYSIYQIFTGNLSGKVLSNVKWGTNGTGTVGTDVDKSVLDALTAINGQTSDTVKLAEIEKYFNASSTAVGTVKAPNKYQAVPGYYLIKDKDRVGENDSYTKYIVQVVGPTTIERKADVPEMEKKVKEKNDTKNETTDWQDASDYDIGDKVPYQITTKIVENYDAYTKYYLSFSDTMEEGLDFVADTTGEYALKVMAGNEDITDAFTLAVKENNHGFTLTCDDLKTKASSVTKNTEIKVTYFATLNNMAKIGSEGNKNTANMEFSNNPNQTGEGTPDTGKTPDDTVITFTYKTVVDKIHKENDEEKPLKGAGFTLYKFVKDYQSDADEQEKAGNNYKKVKSYTAGDKTQFTFAGIDAGKYKLVETTTPAGYNTITPIEFTISTKFGEEDKENNLVLEEMSVDNNMFTVEKKEGTAEPTGTINTKVLNNKGSELPSTGGIGTTIFYVIGSLLVLCAGVVLVAKKRANA